MYSNEVEMVCNDIESQQPETHDVEEDLRLRIKGNIRRSGPTSIVVHLWSGYLAGLLEHGVLTSSAYHKLSTLLPDVSAPNLYELFDDEQMPVTRRA